MKISLKRIQLLLSNIFMIFVFSVQVLDISWSFHYSVIKENTTGQQNASSVVISVNLSGCFCSRRLKVQSCSSLLCSEACSIFSVCIIKIALYYILYGFMLLYLGKVSMHFGENDKTRMTSSCPFNSEVVHLVISHVKILCVFVCVSVCTHTCANMSAKDQIKHYFPQPEPHDKHHSLPTDVYVWPPKQ